MLSKYNYINNLLKLNNYYILLIVLFSPILCISANGSINTSSLLYISPISQHDSMSIRSMYVELDNGNDELIFNLLDISDSLRKSNSNEAKGHVLIAIKYIHKSDILNRQLLAKSYHILGKILIDSKDYNEGIDTLKRCIEIEKEVYGNNQLILAKTYNYIGVGYIGLHELRNAHFFLEKSIRILTENGVIDMNLYDAHSNMGIIFAQLRQFDNALEYFDIAYEILESIDSIDAELEAGFYNNYGLITSKFDKLLESNYYYGKADSIYVKLYGKSYYKLARININRGLNSYLYFDFEKAELYYKRALNIYSVQDNAINNGVEICYYNLSSVYYSTGQTLKAIEYCKKGLELNPDSFLRIKCYKNLAKLYYRNGDTIKADFYFKKSLSLLEKSSEIENPYKIQLLSAYASFLYSKEEYDEALNYYQDTYKLLCKSPDYAHEVTASVLSRIGLCHKVNMDFDSASFYINKSIALYDSLSTSEICCSQHIVDLSFMEQVRPYPYISLVFSDLFT